MWRYTARAQARKFTARPGGQWLQQWVRVVPGGADRSAPRRVGAIARAPRIKPK